MSCGRILVCDMLSIDSVEDLGTKFYNMLPVLSHGPLGIQSEVN